MLYTKNGKTWDKRGVSWVVSRATFCIRQICKGQNVWEKLDFKRRALLITFTCASRSLRYTCSKFWHVKKGKPHGAGKGQEGSHRQPLEAEISVFPPLEISLSSLCSFCRALPRGHRAGATGAASAVPHVWPIPQESQQLSDQ